jgi:hypothetical protein
MPERVSWNSAILALESSSIVSFSGHKHKAQGRTRKNRNIYELCTFLLVSHYQAKKCREPLCEHSVIYRGIVRETYRDSCNAMDSGRGSVVRRRILPDLLTGLDALGINVEAHGEQKHKQAKTRQTLCETEHMH